MNSKAFRESILDPALAFLALNTGLQSDDRARILLLAIAGQESDLRHRKQVGGPARGFWQFEKPGGVRGVLNHPASAMRADKLCRALEIEPKEDEVYEAIAYSDHLATGFARLLLWTDSAPLPAINDAEAGWQYYQRLWRPGKPRRTDWDANYSTAVTMVIPPK